MAKKDDNFLDDKFDSEEERNEFNNQFEQYRSSLDENNLNGNIMSFFNDKFKLYIELQKILSEFDKWESKNLSRGSFKKVPNKLASKITGDENSGMYAYKTKKFGLITKVILN